MVSRTLRKNAAQWSRLGSWMRSRRPPTPAEWVLNHLPRKEDMFFDREEEGREILLDALRHHDRGVAPIEALRLLAHRLVAEQRPYVEFSNRSQGFTKTIESSETLKARARAIRDELAQAVTAVLTEGAGRGSGDADARLAADLLQATWTVAFIEPHLSAEAGYRRSEDHLSRHCRQGDRRSEGCNGGNALRLSGQGQCLRKETSRAFGQTRSSRRPDRRSAARACGSRVSPRNEEHCDCPHWRRDGRL